jgi:hypothetical protein
MISSEAIQARLPISVFATGKTFSYPYKSRYLSQTSCGVAQITLVSLLYLTITSPDGSMIKQV